MMVLRGLLFARSWTPPTIFTSSAEELRAMDEIRTRRHQRWYNWARFGLVCVLILVFCYCVGSIINYYVNYSYYEFASDFNSSLDGHESMLNFLDEPVQNNNMESKTLKTRELRNHQPQRLVSGSDYHRRRPPPPPGPRDYGRRPPPPVTRPPPPPPYRSHFKPQIDPFKQQPPQQQLFVENSPQNVQHQQIDDLVNNSSSSSTTTNSSSIMDCDFKCVSDGLCLSSIFQCDNEVNCVDESDEQNCNCTEQLGPEKICNGIKDCVLGEDEAHCNDNVDEVDVVEYHPSPCQIGLFDCATDEYTHTNETSSCIDPHLICDGSRDCQNGLDEAFCVTLSIDLHELKENKTTNFTNGFVLLRVRNEWHPYCTREDWSNELSEAICQKEIGYTTLVDMKLFELEEINRLRKGQKEAYRHTISDYSNYEEEEETNLLIIQKDEQDLSGKYEYIKDESSTVFKDCFVAFISCSN